MSKDLLSFLFSESFKPDTDEVIASVTEQMAEVEGLEVKKQPLEKALKELKVTAKIEVDENGAYSKFEDACGYTEAADVLKAVDAVVKLAELGWVASFGNDTASNNDPACFIIKFIDISEVEPSDSDKVPDLEKLVKDMNDGNDDGPEGIGADEKAPKGGDKGGKVPAAPKVKSAIKDSVEEGLYEESFDAVMASYQQLSEDVRQAVREAAVETLAESGFTDVQESDVDNSIVRLYREFGSWDDIAKS